MRQGRTEEDEKEYAAEMESEQAGEHVGVLTELKGSCEK